MNFSADRIISVGSLRMTLPAFIVALAALVMGGFLSMKVHTVVGLMLMLVMFVNAYTVNCTITGHCNVWAWVLTVTYVLATAMIISGKHLSKK